MYVHQTSEARDITHCLSLHLLLYCVYASSKGSDSVIEAATFDFQQYGILTSVDSDEPVQPQVSTRAPMSFYWQKVETSL